MTKKGARQHKEDGRAKEKWQELNKDVEERTIGFISADCHQSVTRGNSNRSAHRASNLSQRVRQKRNHTRQSEMTEFLVLNLSRRDLNTEANETGRG